MRDVPRIFGQSRVDEDPHALHVVVELLLGQRADHRRDIAQPAIDACLGEVHFDVEVDFQLGRRGIDEHFVRRNRLAERRCQ